MCYVSSGNYAMSMNLYMHALFAHFIYLCCAYYDFPVLLGILSYLFSFPQLCYNEASHKVSYIFDYLVLIPSPTDLQIIHPDEVLV